MAISGKSPGSKECVVVSGGLELPARHAVMSNRVSELDETAMFVGLELRRVRGVSLRSSSENMKANSMRAIAFVGVIIGGLSVTVWCSTLAGAQSVRAGYPSQPVRIIIPFAAGGATDVTARIVGQKMAEEWGATVVIENKPGDTGAIAAEDVAKAKPDGYTLLMGTGSVNSVSPAVKEHLPFDTLRVFVAVSHCVGTPNTRAARP